MSVGGRRRFITWPTVYCGAADTAVTLSDMPRSERNLDPSTGPIAAFATELRKMRVEAGTPKYLQMARRTGRSRTALAEAAGGDHLPTWETVEAYVRACGRDPAEWLARWEQARDEVKADRSPDAREPAPALVTGSPATNPPGRRLPRRGLLLAAAAAVVGAGLTAGLRRDGDDTPAPTGPRTLTWTGAQGPVMLSFARFDPQHLAAARSTGQVAVTNVDDGSIVNILDLHQSGHTAVTFDCLDRGVLLAAGPSGVVRLWHYPDGRALMALPAPGRSAISHLVSDPDNRHHLAAAHGQVVTIWRTDTGQRQRDFDVGQTITALAYDPQTRNTLAVARQDGTVAIWDSSNGRLVRPLQGRLTRPTALAFDPLTRNTLATAEAGGSVRIWDSSTGRPVRSIRNTVPVGALAFNPLIRNSLATGNSDGAVRIWDSSTGLPVHTLQGERARVTAVAYAADGKRLAAGTDNGTVTVWPVQDWQ